MHEPGALSPSPDVDPRLDRRARRADAAVWSQSSRLGVVAAAHYLAADAGAEVLGLGGNAVDAAIATALALNVVEPAASGLGGMAMALVHLPGQAPVVFDGACLAPRAATPERVAASASRYRGPQAIAVPMAAAAWHAMHERFGRLSLTRVVAPAVALARRGLPLSPTHHELAATYRRALQAGDAGTLLLDGSGLPRPIGSELRQPVLADTLEQLGRAGLMDFYYGQVADELVRDLAERGAFVALADLRDVQAPAPRAALSVPFLGRTAWSVGPPAGGLSLLQLCGMVDSFGRAPDPRDPDDLVLLLRLIRRVRRDRQRFRLRTGARDVGEAGCLLDPERLLCAVRDPDAVDRAGARLDGEGATPGETSHLCAMDNEGATVSMTMSIERSFGSACMTPSLGFLYNGYLRAFKLENRRHPHFLTPGAPARSNAAPTVILDEPMGPARLAIGSTGSERMVSGIFTTLLRLEREEPFDAVAAPRVHCTPDGLVLAEAERLPGACRAAITAGFEVEDTGPWAFKFGGLQLAARDAGGVLGVGEPRRDGGASSPPVVR